MLVCLGVALAITMGFFKEVGMFTGLMGNWAICMVPIEVVIGVVWAGRYPAEKFDNPWRGIALTLLMFIIGSMALLFLAHVIGGGDPTSPILSICVIWAVIITMFWTIAFGSWPFHKMSLPAKGFLTLIGAYLVLMAGFRLLNFNEIGVGAAGGYVPFLPGLGINPDGPISWDAGTCFFFMMIAFMFVQLALGFWPISKFKSLMSQPIMGICVFILCFALAFATYGIMVWGMDLDPVRSMTYVICFAFGLLGCLFMFQAWPGRMWSQPAGGFVNLIFAAILGIIAFFAVRAFCGMVFGPELFVADPTTGLLMLGPFGWFAVATVMLGLTFPAWAIYGPAWDFWPLPPTPPPPG
jgi:hypothetical protein